MSTEFSSWRIAPIHLRFSTPTFCKFRFTDCEEISHNFEYSLEAGRHHDETYRDLIAEFERFFEAKRIAREFYER